MANFVDDNGRVIPIEGMGNVVDADKHIQYIQSIVGYSDVYQRVIKHFPEGTIFVSEEEYIKQAESLIAEVEADWQVGNLLKGSYFPLPLPKIRRGDYGEVFQQDFLSAVVKSFQSQFLNRKFNNWRKNELACNMSVVDERHAQLVERLTENPLVGLYFLNPFQGFGIEADRQMIQSFPVGYSLSGGIDASIAFVADPKTLARNHKTPVTDCAALSWKLEGYSFDFDPDDASLNFCLRGLDASAGFSAGLLFVG